MDFWQIAILAAVQGAAELLPVSSSAHVIAAEKLMGLDPTDPALTLLLVMLHTGTMLAVIVYFRHSWRETYFSSLAALRANAWLLLVGTALTGAVGLALMMAITRALAAHAPAFEIEHLFGNARLMAAALCAAGLLIIVSSRSADSGRGELSTRQAAWVGAVQGLCLPFRGFSRSGATISTAMALGVGRRKAEEFSFALAVVLTPPVIAREGYRLLRAHAQGQLASTASLGSLALSSLIGMALSFAVGLLALRLLSRFLEQGRWHLFGLYCFAAAAAVLVIG